MNSHTGININGTAALNEDGTINVSLNGVLNPNDTPDPDDQAWSRAFALHGENLVCLVTGRWPFIDWFYRLFETEPVSNFGYRVSIAEMQRMYMKHLQIKLTNIAVSLHLDKNIKDHSKNLENLLKLYTQAVRDYEYMTKVSQQKYDLFIVSSERAQDRAILGRAMLSGGNLDHTNEQKKAAIPTGPWERPDKNGRTEPIGGTRSANVNKLLHRAFWLRVGEAVVGGAFLIGPMWLIVLKRGMIFSLGATTVCVALFGLILVLYSNAPGQVFAGTLAYTAVLMVLVGLTV